MSSANLIHAARWLLFFATAATACAVGSNDLGDSAGDGAGAPQGTGNTDRDAQAAGGGDAAPAPITDGKDASPAGNDASSASDAAFAGDAAVPPPPPPAPDASAPDASAPDSSVSGCAAHGFNGAIASFDLSAQPGTESSVAGSVVSGVASATLTRAAAITATSGTGSINGSNWSTGASADGSKYYSITIAPASGCTLSLASLALSVRASSTGPASGDVATGAGGFGTHSASFAGTGSGNVAISASGSGALEVRVYGYGATSSSGTFRIEGTLTVSGAIN